MKRLCLVAAFSALLLGAAHLQAAEETPSYTKDIQPFLKRYCVECHGPNKPKSGVRVDSYEAMMSGSRKGKKNVIAGDPDASRIIMTMTGKAKQMPPRKYAQHPTREEIAKVSAWIKAGAKKDTAAPATKSSQGPTPPRRSEPVAVTPSRPTLVSPR